MSVLGLDSGPPAGTYAVFSFPPVGVYCKTSSDPQGFYTGKSINSKKCQKAACVIQRFDIALGIRLFYGRENI